MGDKAIVFFSRNGSTRRAAEILAERTGAKLVELKELVPKRGFIHCGFRAMMEKHSPLSGNPWAESSESDTLILAAPIWAGRPNPAMNSFLDRVDLNGKIVYILTMQADPKHRKSAEVIEHYSGRVKDAGGKVAGSIALTGASPGKTAKEEDLRPVLESWKFD
jgi:multimeric flavodoxin WrbA